MFWQFRKCVCLCLKKCDSGRVQGQRHTRAQGSRATGRLHLPPASCLLLLSWSDALQLRAERLQAAELYLPLFLTRQIRQTFHLVSSSRLLPQLTFPIAGCCSDTPTCIRCFSSFRKTLLFFSITTHSIHFKLYFLPMDYYMYFSQSKNIFFPSLSLIISQIKRSFT